MVSAQTVKQVAETYKQLKPSEKRYIVGVMQGILLAREHPRPRTRPKDTPPTDAAS